MKQWTASTVCLRLPDGGCRQGGAEEFLANYREILEENPRSEEVLVREIGKPCAAAHLTADRGAYCRWLSGFTVLALCRNGI